MNLFPLERSYFGVTKVAFFIMAFLKGLLVDFTGGSQHRLQLRNKVYLYCFAFFSIPVATIVDFMVLRIKKNKKIICGKKNSVQNFFTMFIQIKKKRQINVKI